MGMLSQNLLNASEKFGAFLNTSIMGLEWMASTKFIQISEGTLTSQAAQVFGHQRAPTL